MKVSLIFLLQTLCLLLTVQGSTTPVLNDGSPTTILEFLLPSSGEKTLTELDLDLTGTTQLDDLTEITLTHIRRAGNRTLSTSKIEQHTTINGPLTVPRGNHILQLSVRTRPNAQLLHKISVNITAIHFTDGSQYTDIPQTLPNRLAYCIHRRHDFHCHTFRIPGIARAKNGNLLAVADMRYHSRGDLQGHMDIGLRISKDGGQTWSPPRPIMDMGEYGGKPQDQNGCSDPCILVDETTGEIFVAACWTHGKPNTHQWRGRGSEPGLSIHQSTQFLVVRSTDHGTTWSPPENWTAKLKNPAWHLFAPAPGNGITLHDGTLVIPTQGRDATGLPFSNMTYSKDHGQTWQVSSPARDNTTECAVAQLSDHSLLLNIRDNRNRADKSETNGRAVAQTTNLGKTWTVHSTDHSTFPEPVCMASLIADPHRNGTLYFSNPNHKKFRSHMTIRCSTDDGNTWPKQILLDSRGGGYSSLVVVDKNHLGILYESSVADMIFQIIPIADFNPKNPLPVPPSTSAKSSLSQTL